MDDQRTDRTGGNLSESPTRGRFRFNLKTLLAIVTLVAVALGAYMVGHRNGDREGFHRGVSTTSSDTVYGVTSTAPTK